MKSVTLPQAVLDGLRAELQGTRDADNGGFVWYVRDTGEEIRFEVETSTLTITGEGIRTNGTTTATRSDDGNDWGFRSF